MKIALSFFSLFFFITSLLEGTFSEPTLPMEFVEGKSYYAVIYTPKGEVTCALFPKIAPISVTNFIQLATAGFYNGLTFHQVVPGIVVQGGASALPYTLPAELGLSHEVGSLALARLPDVVNPSKRSNSSQFYIILDAVSFIDNSYTIFGKVIDGMDALSNIEVHDFIEKIEIKVE